MRVWSSLFCNYQSVTSVFLTSLPPCLRCIARSPNRLVGRHQCVGPHRSTSVPRTTSVGRSIGRSWSATIGQPHRSVGRHWSLAIGPSTSAPSTTSVYGSIGVSVDRSKVVGRIGSVGVGCKIDIGRWVCWSEVRSVDPFLRTVARISRFVGRSLRFGQSISVGRLHFSLPHSHPA